MIYYLHQPIIKKTMAMLQIATLLSDDAQQPERLSHRKEWRVEVGGVAKRASFALSVTFIHIDDDSHNSWTHPSLPLSACSSCEGYQLLSLLPRSSAADSHTDSPPLRSFPCVWVVRTTFEPGFTLLGDGPVAVALVVRWSACLTQTGAEEEGGEREVMETGTDSGQSTVVKKRVGQIWLGFSAHHYDGKAVGTSGLIHHCDGSCSSQECLSPRGKCLDEKLTLGSDLLWFPLDEPQWRLSLQTCI